jgi:hypothetical protein
MICRANVNSTFDSKGETSTFAELSTDQQSILKTVKKLCGCKYFTFYNLFSSFGYRYSFGKYRHF